MLSNFFWRSTNRQQRVNKKLYVETDSVASSRGQAKYTKYATFPWPPLEAALPMFNVFFFVKKTIFEKLLIKTKAIAINAES